jgi:hypothetical protein
MTPTGLTTPVLTITRRNVREVTGMSWARCLTFARDHGVPVRRLSPRTTVIDAGAFRMAFARLAEDGTVPAGPPMDALDLVLRRPLRR